MRNWSFSRSWPPRTRQSPVSWMCRRRSPGLRCGRAFRRSLEDCAYGAEQPVHFGVTADADAQPIFESRMIEPPHEDFACAQSIEPLLRRKAWRPRENKVRLAWRDFEAKFTQFGGRAFASGDHAFKVFPIIRQVIQCGGGRNLCDAIDIIAIANFMQRGDEGWVADHVADAQKAERITF